MATKRKPTPSNSTSKLNFRPNLEKNEPKGTKPTADRSSVKNVILMMIQHVCRKLLFMDIKLRVFIYLGFIFFFSILADVLPVPKGLASTLSVSKGNILNTYFVKVGWGWTLLLGLPFCALTSFVYCCGKRDRILKHVSRFLISTFFWYFWTASYNYVESMFGRCNVKDMKMQSKPVCLGKGYYWQSVDISGHCFILLYSTLILIEECRVIIGWEGVADMIREEEYNRSKCETNSNILSPLRNLSSDEFEKLKASYPKLTPYIRTLFILITCLIIIWDIMLVTTVLFYHNMLEKLIAALSAIITWYFTYYLWYSSPKLLPALPGEGLFKYKDTKQTTIPLKKKGSFVNKTPGPRFMGMPLKVPAPEENTPNEESV